MEHFEENDEIAMDLQAEISLQKQQLKEVRNSFVNKENIDSIHTELEQMGKKLKLSSFLLKKIEVRKERTTNKDSNITFSGTMTQVRAFIKFLSEYTPVSSWTSVDIKQKSKKIITVEGRLLFISTERMRSKRRIRRRK